MGADVVEFNQGGGFAGMTEQERRKEVEVYARGVIIMMNLAF